jgi:hypothetical protein
MIRAIALAVATCAVACHATVDPPGVPLYPNGATARLPRNQIAYLAGPIAKIDEQDVVDQGGSFELLPGCHIVELERRLVADGYALSGGVYWTGNFPTTIYAIRMKPGARYIIRREIRTGEMVASRVMLSAREEEASGKATDLVPATSEADIKACMDQPR